MTNERRAEVSANPAGIDYGMGRTNINHATGIRYGCISQHDILQAWADSSEPQYGEPTCPKCGNDAKVVPSHTESSDPVGAWVMSVQDMPEAYGDYETARSACGDYACESCRYLFDSDEAFGDEPNGYTYDADGYRAESCLDSDVMVLESPYYTYAPFCSPCVPGAGNLNDAIPTITSGQDVTDLVPRGVKTYCFGPDWFDDGKAPYRVFRVADDVELLTEGEG